MNEHEQLQETASTRGFWGVVATSLSVFELE